MNDTDWALDSLTKEGCNCGDDERESCPEDGSCLVCVCKRALKAGRGQAEAAKRIIAGVHGALADAGDVSVPCDLAADLAPAVRELVRQRDVARRRIWGLEAEVCTRLASEAILHCRLAEAEQALETARVARCHSRTVVPGASESPECGDTPTMCDRHAHDLMTALREAESAAEALRVELEVCSGGDTP